tara:strand:- start:75 stop:605 length:531 start_codon:yes stop_codon:yes gene_type:complete
MDKPNSKSKETEIAQHKTGRESLFLGGIIVFLIAVSPLIFYAYKSFPEVQVWETSFFKSETAFYSFYDYMWYVANKLVPLYLLLLWFFTCKHWWHWIILVPIAMYTFQLWGVINESQDLDELELFYILPLMMVLVPIVYLIRARLFNQVRGNDLKSFEEDLLIKKTMWQQIRDLFR